MAKIHEPCVHDGDHWNVHLRFIYPAWFYQESFGICTVKEGRNDLATSQFD